MSKGFKKKDPANEGFVGTVVFPREWPRKTVWCLVALAALFGIAGVVQGWRARASPEELLQQALSGLDQGDLQPFRRAMRALRPRAGYDSYVRLLNAVWHLRSGRHDDALQQFAALAPAGQIREPTLLYTAQALHAANRLSEAEFVLRTLVTERPTNAEARRWLGIIYYDLGAYDPAIVQLRELAKLVPSDYRPHRLIGLMYRDFEQEHEAIESYREALSRAPPDDVRNEMLQELAKALVSLRRCDEARKVIAQARATAVLKVLAAECYWSDGQVEPALRELHEARRLDPAERTAFLLEAQIAGTQGDPKTSLTLLRQAASLHPYDAECHYRLGLALRDAGESEEAEIELATWNRLKEFATRLSQLNFKALGNPHDITVREQLAEVCDALGKNELAAMWRRTVAALRIGQTPPEKESESGLSNSFSPEGMK